MATSDFSGYANFSAVRDTKRDANRGYKDGLEGTPKADAKPFSNYEWQVIQTGRRDSDRYRASKEAEIGTITQSIQIAERKRHDTYDGEQSDLASRLHAEADELRRSSGPQSPKALELERIEDEANQSYAAIRRREGGRDVRIQMAKPLFDRIELLRWLSVYTFLMLVLSIAEMPINRPAFEAILQADTVIPSLIVALLLGILLMTFAHFVGIFFRQSYGSKSLGGSWGRALSGITLFLVVSFAVYHISVLRQANTGENANISAGTGPLVNAISGNAAKQAPATNEKKDGGFFFSDKPLNDHGRALLLVNMGVFIAGILLSFFRHDPNPAYEAAYHAREAARRATMRQREDFNQQLAALEQEFGAYRSDITSEADKLDRDLDRLRSEEDSLRCQMHHDLQQLCNSIKQRIQAYQDGVQKGYLDSPEHIRSVSEAPTYFGAQSNTLVEKIILEQARMEDVL